MKKDYKVWSNEKSNLHNEKIRANFHEREIWHCSAGENIGFEQDGQGETFLRPALILRKFNNEVLWMLPLTKTFKKGPYYFNFTFLEGITSSAILSQIRLIDAKRLQYKIGDMGPEDFAKIKEKFKQLLA
jgi:mRNA-degrading endonuclease toxin of MazEF toxin-antitoxin module